MKPPVLLAIERLGTTAGASRGVRRSQAEQQFHQHLFTQRSDAMQTKAGDGITVCTDMEGIALPRKGRCLVTWLLHSWVATHSYGFTKQLFYNVVKLLWPFRFVVFFSSWKLKMKSWPTYFLTLMCFSAFFSTVCFHREWEHLLSHCPLTTHTVSLWISNYIHAGQNHITYFA